MKQYLALVKDDLAQAEADSLRLSTHYGDFAAFFYRPDFDLFLRQEVLPFQQPTTDYLAFLDNDHWGAKNPFNFPGPFYSGESDTCGTGLDQAPANVMLAELVGSVSTPIKKAICSLCFRTPKPRRMQHRHLMLNERASITGPSSRPDLRICRCCRAGASVCRPPRPAAMHLCVPHPTDRIADDIRRCAYDEVRSWEVVPLRTAHHDG